MTKAQGTDYFFRGHPLSNVQARASYRVRRRIYDWFCAEIGGVEGKTILDHGSTPDLERLDSNCFIRWLLEDGAQVLCASPEDLSGLAEALPDIRVLDWPLTPAQLPPVDYVLSSAVLEHVGSEVQQIQYIADLLTLAPGVLMTTPNRYHWLEFHTKLPLIHWLPRPWHRRLLGWIGLKDWQREEHLRLVSKGDVDQFIAAAQTTTGACRVDWFRPRFLGMISNLATLLRQEP